MSTIVRRIDLKHHIDEKGQIVKTGNGVLVPENEPLILTFASANPNVMKQPGVTRGK